ncbi:aldehyde dehydrogenase family protein, partial [Escherichia coli]
ANTSFVNRIADESIPLDDLVADPVAVVEKMHADEGTLGLPHPKIPLPRALYGDVRANSSGIDLANEQRLASLSSALLAGTSTVWTAEPTIGDAPYVGGPSQLRQPVRNPSDLRDVVGHVTEATEADVDAALSAAAAAAPIWQATPPEA